MQGQIIDVRWTELPRGMVSDRPQVRWTTAPPAEPARRGQARRLARRALACVAATAVVAGIGVVGVRNERTGASLFPEGGPAAAHR